MDGTIRSSLQDGIQHLAIDRTGRKNALTAALYVELEQALARSEADPAVRVVLLSGEGGNFTSGNDLQDFRENPPRDAKAPVFGFVDRLAGLEKPLVAAVEGFAVGIGTTLLLHCDLVHAGAGARFLLPFANLGLSPEAGSSLLLPLRAGHARASEMLLLGQPFGTGAARDAGLVNAVVDDGSALESARNACTKLAAQPAAALRAAKRLLRDPWREPLQAALERETAVFLERVASDEAREAFAAFAEKRRPDFSRFPCPPRRSPR